MAIHGAATRSIVVTVRGPQSQFRADVLAGLARTSKAIPCKYFYDARGSALFDQICELPEYYLTRTEISIMRRYAGAMAEALGPDCLLIEFGSGSSVKTPILIEALRRPAGYIPVDISREHLCASANRLGRHFTTLEIKPVWADFTESFELPRGSLEMRRAAVYFPGSTIGNFTPEQALQLMKEIARLAGPGGALLIGVDLVKSVAILESAYNDGAGVTAEFNLNLLARINRELEGQFELDSFAHRAFFSESSNRIEMHLVSKKAQSVSIGQTAFAFNEAESIHTENSYKFRPEDFTRLALQAGFETREIWTDDEQHFGVFYLTVC